MRRRPRPPYEGVFAHGLGVHIIWVGILMAALALGTEMWLFEAQSRHWQSMVFTILALSQLGHVLAIRSERESLATQGMLSNAPLATAVGLTIVLQLAVLYVPALNDIFAIEPLSLVELAVTFEIASIILGAVEIEKWAKRRFWPSRIGDPQATSDLPR